MHGAVKRGDPSALALRRLSAVGIIWEGSVSAHILLKNAHQNRLIQLRLLVKCYEFAKICVAF